MTLRRPKCILIYSTGFVICLKKEDKKFENEHKKKTRIKYYKFNL